MKTFTQTKYALPAIILAMMITAFALYSFSNAVRPAVASITTYESYNSTTTRAANASGTFSSNVCKDNCQFGSIIVTQAGTAGYVQVWNATSTATSTYQDVQASTTASITWGKPIAKIAGATDAAGTYVFDTIMTNGIVIETSTGFDGEYVITFKR
jgi:hypothetical protein